MGKLLVSSAALLAVTLAQAQAPAPAKAPSPAATPATAAQAPVEVEASGTPGKATAKRTAKATATITATDVAARTVTLKAKSGETQTFKVGPDVKRFAEFAVGDVIRIEYEQGLALEFQPAGSENVPVTAIATGGRAGKDQAPGAAASAGVRGTVTVTAIDMPRNYDMPDTTDAYTHRIGRTGRAEKTGDAFSFITREDEDVVRSIERVLGEKVERRTVKEFHYKKVAPARRADGQQFRSADIQKTSQQVYAPRNSATSATRKYRPHNDVPSR